MKTLFLMRHAKSSWNDSTLDDHERPLNQRGKDNAPIMAKRLHKLGIKPDALFTSTAMRAAATAQVFAKHLDFPQPKISFDPNLYLATAGMLQDYVSKIENSLNSVLIFGHNPGLTLLVAQVWGLPINNIPTCGIVSLKFGSSTWEEASSQLPSDATFDFPKNSSPPISFSEKN
jgi:phosphohistidine phosphatase